MLGLNGVDGRMDTSSYELGSKGGPYRARDWGMYHVEIELVVVVDEEVAVSERE